MLTATINKTMVRQLAREMRGSSSKVSGDVAIAMNATARKTKTGMSKRVRTELATSAKAVNRTIEVSKKATKGNLNALVAIKQTDRIPLKEFRPNQTKRGVSYRISKTGGRKRVDGAFVSTSLGSHVYKRRGKQRLPIQKLYGPSPWGVFRKQKMKPPTVQETQKELIKQIERRIQFRRFKRKGK